MTESPIALSLDPQFKKASHVESLVWEMRLADFPRAINRAKVNDLNNGAPPYTTEEVLQNNITHNFNTLESTTITHNARRQFYTGLEAPDPLFNVNIDYGPSYRRKSWANRITKEINKIIKESVRFKECQRSVFAMDVLHGIGPSTWEDKKRWCPRAIGIEDVLIPSGTWLDMENLPFFAIYKQWTGMQLWKMTHGPRVDPGWDMDGVDRALEWVDKQASSLMGSSWPEVWSPEKWSERLKEDSGLYSSDKVPTIDTYEFYYWSDEKKNSGWRKRIILDAWGTPGMGGVGGINFSRDRKFTHGKGSFLYDSGNRVYASKLSEIIHWQFADCSAVAPFRYHSVRSLGWLLYAICQIQNRVRCKFTEAAIECMMQYLRSNNPEDAERALSINLIDKRVLPAGIDFVPRDQRWEVDAALVQNVLQLNRQTMADNSSSFTQDFDFADEAQRDETATRTLAKVNSTAALIGAMLQQAYDYEKFKQMEICRRFTKKDSKDGDIQRFRVRCLSSPEQVPEEVLDNVDCWDVQPARVVGSGNKMVQGAMMQQMMAIYYDKLNPEAQQKVLKMGVAITLDDYQLADELVPDQQHISDSVTTAQLAVGTIMAGATVAPKPGVNIVETIETWLHGMAQIMSGIEQSGDMATEEELVGLENFGQHIGQRIQLLAQDQTMKQQVKIYSDDLGKLMNLVKAYAQRLAEQQQQQQGNGQISPEDQAKIAATEAQSQSKIQLAQQSHAQKTAQREISFEMKTRQDATKHKQDLAAKDLETASNINRNRLEASKDEDKGKD